MSVLMLVRHGQTKGFLTDGYVHLTPLGEAQAAATGRWLAAEGVMPDAVFIGPQLRHGQTHDLARAAAGGGWPDPVLLDGLDEHQGLQVFAHAVQQELVPAELLQRSGDDEDGATSHAMLRAFQRVLRRWVRGELTIDGVETWQAFRGRIHGAVERMCEEEARGRTAVAFTSGGAVGAAVASVLDVPSPETTLDLGFAVSNCSLTELRFSRSRRGLAVFNATPHLGGDAARSAV